jgi:hypothetical protein
MKEATIYCNNHGQITSAVGQVANLLTQYSYQSATGEHQGVEIEVKPAKGGSATQTQKNALWLWCTLLANELNNAGVEYWVDSPIFKHKIPSQWTKDLVMDYIWRPVMKAMTGETTTRNLEKLDCSAIEQVVAKHLSENHGVPVPQWPSLENQHG